MRALSHRRIVYESEAGDTSHSENESVGLKIIKRWP